MALYLVWITEGEGVLEGVGVAPEQDRALCVIGGILNIFAVNPEVFVAQLEFGQTKLTVSSGMGLREKVVKKLPDENTIYRFEAEIRSRLVFSVRRFDEEA